MQLIIINTIGTGHSCCSDSTRSGRTRSKLFFVSQDPSTPLADMTNLHLIGRSTRPGLVPAGRQLNRLRVANATSTVQSSRGLVEVTSAHVRVNLCSFHVPGYACRRHTESGRALHKHETRRRDAGRRASRHVLSQMEARSSACTTSHRCFRSRLF